MVHTLGIGQPATGGRMGDGTGTGMGDVGAIGGVDRIICIVIDFIAIMAPFPYFSACAVIVIVTFIFNFKSEHVKKLLPLFPQ